MTESGAGSVWSLGGRSVMGATHITYGIPNQDAIAWRPRTGPSVTAVLAVADGHGAAMHYRSGIGAHIAVDVATAVLAEALDDSGWIAAADEGRGRALVGEIIARWRAEVSKDVAARPLPSGRAGSDPFIPYGATLVAAAAAPGGICVLQLGDGDILLAGADGAVLRPLPSDEGMIGEQTYSLCQSSAESHVRLRILGPGDGDVDFVMLSTDGLSKSFADEAAFRRLAGFWRKAVSDSGLPAVVDGLDPWLSDISGRGSGDDITLGFMVRGAAPPQIDNEDVDLINARP